MTTLSLPVHEHGTLSIYLDLWLRSSELVYFSSHRSCTRFVRLAHMHFIWGDADVNDSVFLLSNSTCSLMVSRKVTGFYTSPLNPKTLLQLLVSSRHFVSFCFQFFWIFYMENHVIYEQRQFYFSLPYLFLKLTALISSFVWWYNFRNGYTCNLYIT